MPHVPETDAANAAKTFPYAVVEHCVSAVSTKAPASPMYATSVGAAAHCSCTAGGNGVLSRTHCGCAQSGG